MIVWKYPLKLEDTQKIQIPEGSKLLSVQMQNKVLTMWALVEPMNPPVTKMISVIGTGIPMLVPPGKYIGTVQVDEFVLHVFDRTDLNE